MNDSTQTAVSDRKPATRRLTVAIGLIVVTAALAAVILWGNPAVVSSPTIHPVPAVAGSQLSEVSGQLYPTQRESGLPAYDHGR